MTKQPGLYSIPGRFRQIENLHIVFWLIKDLSWAMLWKPLGLFMIVPTIMGAVIITWQTRTIKAELFHNLAVDFWICANAYWMIAEFWELPEHYRYYTAIPFSIGIGFITIYYLVILPGEKRNKNRQL
ncbi:MAG: hypothetical protein WKF97_07710 [Chitinophagaceae bacterium]